MGQAHIVVNLDKREFLDPHKLGDGLKLREQCHGGRGILPALHMLLACSNGRGCGDYPDHPMIGRWAGDRIAVVGDYAEDSDLPARFKASLIYAQCRVGDTFKDISDEIAPLVEQVFGFRFVGAGWRDTIPKD